MIAYGFTLKLWSFLDYVCLMIAGRAFQQSVGKKGCKADAHVWALEQLASSQQHDLCDSDVLRGWPQGGPCRLADIPPL